jgi:uncharacterized protein YndB with AHSA1/START domain
LRIGGIWGCEARNADGRMNTIGGRILEIDRPGLLAYTWNPSWDASGETTVRYTLEPIASGTRLRVVHSGFVIRSDSLKRFAQGWPSVLAWLIRYFELGKRM